MPFPSLDILKKHWKLCKFRAQIHHVWLIVRTWILLSFKSVQTFQNIIEFMNNRISFLDYLSSKISWKLRFLFPSVFGVYKITDFKLFLFLDFLSSLPSSTLLRFFTSNCSPTVNKISPASKRLTKWELFWNNLKLMWFGYSSGIIWEYQLLKICFWYYYKI